MVVPSEIVLKENIHGIIVFGMEVDVAVSNN
jgi:hypothetical protein